jgi:hypothetical protein
MVFNPICSSIPCEDVACIEESELVFSAIGPFCPSLEDVDDFEFRFECEWRGRRKKEVLLLPELLLDVENLKGGEHISPSRRGVKSYCFANATRMSFWSCGLQILIHRVFNSGGR